MFSYPRVYPLLQFSRAIDAQTKCLKSFGVTGLYSQQHILLAADDQAGNLLFMLTARSQGHISPVAVEPHQRFLFIDRFDINDRAAADNIKCQCEFTGTRFEAVISFLFRTAIDKLSGSEPDNISRIGCLIRFPSRSSGPS